MPKTKRTPVKVSRASKTSASGSSKIRYVVQPLRVTVLNWIAMGVSLATALFLFSSSLQSLADSSYDTNLASKDIANQGTLPITIVLFILMGLLMYATVKIFKKDMAGYVAAILGFLFFAVLVGGISSFGPYISNVVTPAEAVRTASISGYLILIFMLPVIYMVFCLISNFRYLKPATKLEGILLGVVTLALVLLFPVIQSGFSSYISNWLQTGK